MSKNWLDFICEKYGITCYEISKRSGVAQSTLSNIRKNDVTIRNVKVGVVEDVAFAVGVSCDEIFKTLRSLEYMNWKYSKF